jgi:hypothetical protein
MIFPDLLQIFLPLAADSQGLGKKPQKLDSIGLHGGPKGLHANIGSLKRFRSSWM